tara:strand:- start:2985 stop:3167 length:183 start_codon:yes stop_codon:yes gene_type:complete
MSELSFVAQHTGKTEEQVKLMPCPLWIMHDQRKVIVWEKWQIEALLNSMQDDDIVYRISI